MDTPMDTPEENTYIHLVWLTIKNNKIVHSKEKRYPLLVPGRFTRNEFDGLWDSPYSQREFMYFHITQTPETTHFVHVPDTDWKNIEFEPTLPVYHEFTTLYFVEWIPNAKNERNTKNAKTKKHRPSSHKQTRKKWQGPRFAYSIFAE